MKKLAAIPVGNIRGLGPLGLEDQAASEAPTRFNAYISMAIGLMTAIAAIWFTITLILGAIQLITAGSDKGQLEAARGKITTAIIGLVVVVAALFIVQAIGSLIGIGNLILNPTQILETIGGGQ